MRIKKLAAVAALAVALVGVGTGAQALVDLDAGAEIKLKVDLPDLPGGGPGGGLPLGAIIALAEGVVDCATPPVNLVGAFVPFMDDVACINALYVDVLGEDPLHVDLFGGPGHPFSILGEDVIADGFSILGEDLGPLNVVDDGLLRFVLNGIDSGLTGRL